MSTVLEAALSRRSHSKVGERAPDAAELAPLVQAAGRVADHSALRPWRLIALRGTARERLGAALAEAAGDKKPSSKPMRASLLLAIVFVERPSGKVPAWEQEAVASGVAHTLSLLLHDAGWGVFWRTGSHTRAKAVRKMHGLAKNETLLGWLYVGDIPEGKGSRGPRKLLDPNDVLSELA